MDMNFELKRNDYYKGKRIDVDDMKLEQNYFIDKIKALNSALIGYGIVDGLKIHGVNNTSQTVTVNKGIGIDSHGNFIVLLEQKVFTLPRRLEEGDYIYLRYHEEQEDRIAAGYEDTCSEQCVFDHIVEDVAIYVTNQLLIPEFGDRVCPDESASRSNANGFLKRQEQLDANLSLLYIGQYIKSGEKGSTNPKKRVYLYTHTEITKQLCTIFNSYVSSVNKKNGDLTLVSSINETVPNEDGLIELVAGNNITLTEEDNKITIATSSNFHKESKFLLAAGGSQEIVHNSNTYPSVDIYKGYIVKTPEGKEEKIAMTEREFKAEARFLGKSEETLKEETNAQLFSEVLSTYDKTQHKRKMVHTVLRDRDVKFMSKGVAKQASSQIGYYGDRIWITTKFHYEKVVGGDSSVEVRVTHLDNNTVQIDNLKDEAVNLMVILSA
jgi:hypothetical protein